MFDIRLLKETNLTQHNEPDGRYYTLPDSKKKLYSVTTFLSKTGDSSFLEKWKARVGEKAAMEISTAALERGNTIHECLENFLYSRPYNAGKHLQSFSNISKALKRNVSTILGIEQKLYSLKLGLAGTSDLIALYKDKVSIVDFKGSTKPKKREWIENYILQCLIYARMVEENHDIEIEQLVILVAVEGRYGVQEFIIPKEEFGFYISILENRLTTWRNPELNLL